MTSRFRWSLVAAITLALSASAAFAESVWVKSESVEIRSGKGAVYPTVATAKKGQQLNVVAREGKWVQVQLAGANGAAATSGWVFENALSAQKVDAGGGFAFAPGSTAEMGTAAAGRGLNEGAETYVSSRNLDKRPLEWLISLRKSIAPQEWEKFTASGKVGPSAQ